MINAGEVFRDIDIHHPAQPLLNESISQHHRPIVPIRSRTNPEVRLIDRLQQQENRPLRHLVFQCRNAKRPFGAICFRNLVPPHRRHDVSIGFDACQKVIKIDLQVCIVVRHHAVDVGRAILARQVIGFEHPFTVDRVMQRDQHPAGDASSPDQVRGTQRSLPMTSPFLQRVRPSPPFSVL